MVLKMRHFAWRNRRLISPMLAFAGTFGLTSILLNLALQKAVPDPNSQAYDPALFAHRGNVAITLAFIVGFLQVWALLSKTFL